MHDLYDWCETMHAQVALAAIRWDGARMASTADPNESSAAVQQHLTEPIATLRHGATSQLRRERLHRVGLQRTGCRGVGGAPVR